MLPIKFVDLYAQYQKIKSEIDTAIQVVINESSFIGGKPVENFEAALKLYLGVNYVIPCGNGTDALQLALMSLDLRAGDEVIVPGFTFVAPAEAVALLGFVPVFADVDFDTFNITAETISAVITPKTKAIIVVHLFGQSADMAAIMKVAQLHKLKVIEDVAQSLGAKAFSGEDAFVGTIGDIGCTSFFPSKNLACFGDGGALFTNDADLALKIKMTANHGQQKKYTHDLIGVNSRLDGLQAAVLQVKLKYLPAYIAARKHCAQRYNEYLKHLSWLQIPAKDENTDHSYNQYTLTLNAAIDRENLVAYLLANGVPTMVYYPSTLPCQKAYKDYSSKKLINSEELSKRVLSLPIHTELVAEQQQYIASLLSNYKYDGGK